MSSPPKRIHSGLGLISCVNLNIKPRLAILKLSSYSSVVRPLLSSKTYILYVMLYDPTLVFRATHYISRRKDFQGKLMIPVQKPSMSLEP